MTDEEVEARIAELKADPDVRLAWKEKTVKYKRRRSYVARVMPTV